MSLLHTIDNALQVDGAPAMHGWSALRGDAMKSTYGASDSPLAGKPAKRVRSL